MSEVKTWMGDYLRTVVYKTIERKLFEGTTRLSLCYGFSFKSGFRVLIAILYTVLQFVSVREPTPTLTPQIKSGLVAAHLERH